MAKHMDISDYTAYFHDGRLIDIITIENNIEISMFSAGLEPEWNTRHIPLDPYDALAGKLHLEGVKSIREEGEVLKTFKKQLEGGDIFSLKIEENKVILEIIWETIRQKPRICTGLLTYEIEADKVFWENIPGLVNPYW